MKPVQTQLLEALGSGVRPFDPVPVESGAASDAFADMLGNAMDGRAITQVGVRFAPATSGLFGMEEQHLIARGVDAAAASGIDHALLMHDRHTLRVDVRNRVVMEAIPIQPDRPIVDIDGFVSIDRPVRDEENDDPPPITGTIDAPARVVRNASLMHALAGRAEPIS
ncbi:MAG: hypothetical protein WD114_02060 [Phycisphaerales bacterium]